MSEEESNQGFQTEAKLRVESKLNIEAGMTSEGADKAGNRVALGILLFLTLLGLASLLYVILPNGLIKPLELQQSDSTANIRTSSEKSSL